MNENRNLNRAKSKKNDEFYTFYQDVYEEMQAQINRNPTLFYDKIVLCPCDDYEKSNFTKFFMKNFERLNLKKLICTSYNPDGEGKIYTLENGESNMGYLRGDGDFRSDEVSKLKEEADYIITNPPFSLFREFIDWIGEKKFIILGNVVASCYKNVFLKFRDEKIRFGITPYVKRFKISKDFYDEKLKKGDKSVKIFRGEYSFAIPLVKWYTNVSHGVVPAPIPCKTAAENLTKNKKLINILKNKFNALTYLSYDNYREIMDVPLISAIPSDFSGWMGVPVTFLEKYNPEQFEVMWEMPEGKHCVQDKFIILGQEQYRRLLIRHRRAPSPQSL